MKFLITGIAGFVGSSLAKALLLNNPDAKISGIDNLKFGYQERIIDIINKIHFVQGDVEQIQQHFGSNRFDVIIHCAAVAPLPECQIDSHRALSQNIAICGSIVDFALKNGVRNIIFFSSGAVYEGQQIYPSKEDQIITTRLTYPTTKILAEQFFASICRSHQINVTSLRLFNLYGPNQDYFRKQPPLIGYLLKCLILNETANLYSNGEQRRDYVYIDDLLDLLNLVVIKMMSYNNGGIFTVVNACSGKTSSVNEIISLIQNASGKELKITRNPPQDFWRKYSELYERPFPLDRSIIESEVTKYSEGSPNQAQTIFGWKAKIEMVEGMKHCLEHAIRTIKK